MKVWEAVAQLKCPPQLLTDGNTFCKDLDLPKNDPKLKERCKKCWEQEDRQ